MKKLLAALVLGALLALSAGSSAVLAEGRGNAPNSAQCPAVDSLDAPGATVTVVEGAVIGESADGDDIRVATITLAHGVTSSTHDITYEDNDDSGTLTCLDQVLSFT